MHGALRLDAEFDRVAFGEISRAVLGVDDVVPQVGLEALGQEGVVFGALPALDDDDELAAIIIATMAATTTATDDDEDDGGEGVTACRATSRPTPAKRQTTRFGCIQKRAWTP